jgi:hypothetical protein
MQKEAELRGRKWTKYTRHSKLFYSEKSVEFDVQKGRFRRAQISLSNPETSGESTAG